MEQKKKVAIVNDDMIVGGVSKVLINLLRKVDFSLVEIDLYLLNREGEMLPLIPNEVNVCSVPKYYSRKETLNKLIADKKYFRLLQYLCGCFTSHFCAKDSIKRFNGRKNLISEKKYDVVCAYQAGTRETLITALLRLKGKKKFGCVHGDFGKTWDDCFYEKMPYFVCVSKGAEAIFLSNYPNCKGKTTVINNLIDIEEILRKSNDTVQDMQKAQNTIVTVGRVSYEKGVFLIPKIAQNLFDYGLRFDWYVIGDGDDKPKVEEKCKELCVDKFVHFLGQKENPYPYMKQCTIYVQPSLTEGYCTTTNEAKILCKPIVVTPVSGMDEQFVSGENGLIVKDCSSEAIYEGIKYLIENQNVREKFENNLKEHNVNNEETLKKWYRLFGIKEKDIVASKFE